MRKLLIALGVVALLGADALVARLSVDQRLAEVVPATYYGSGPIQGMQFADYYLPFGGLPPADAAGICATGTSTSICSTVTDAHTWSATQTHSASTPLSFTAAGGSTITNTSTTNPLTITPSTSAALGVGVSINASSLPTPSATTGLAGGALQIIVPEPTNTSTPSPNALEFTGGVNTGGPYFVALDMAASRDGLVFQTNGTVTGARKCLDFINGANTNWFVTCSGNMQNVGTFQYGSSPFTANATTTNEFDSNSTGATVPFMDVSANASAPTGAWFQVCYTSGGGSCGTQEFTVQNDGSALARGAVGQTALCGQTTSNASPSLVTLTGWACKLTSGSASATVFTITYPGSVTLGNAPICLVQDLAAVVSEPTCTTTTTTATLTYSVAPGAVAFANIVLFKNGP